MPDSLRPQAFNDLVGIWAKLAGHHDETSDMAVDRDEDVRLSRPSSRRRRGGGDFPLGDTEAAGEGSAPDGHAAAVDPGFDSLPGLFVDVDRHAQREFRLFGGGDQCLAEDVRGEAVN